MKDLWRGLLLHLTKATAIRLAVVFVSFSFVTLAFFTARGLTKDAPAHQVRQTEFGVSGGNADDETKKFCCSGTLGSLVTDGSTLYILSNNHVLARSDQGQPGEPITQPGLIDNDCNPATVVANLTTAVPLTSATVDAAIAELVPGTMNSDGSILDIGRISSIVTSASIGVKVAKSGRTTGVTKSSIESIHTDVKIVYEAQCNKGPKFSVVYNDQVMVSGANFSASGDSGSLIVTSDECHQPVALLYGGNDTSTVGNPIQDVLDALGVSFVGNGADCSSEAESQVAGAMIPKDLIATAIAAKTGHRDYLMSLREVLGVGVGALENDPAKPAIIVYVDRTLGTTPQLPARLDGVPVQLRMVEQFVAR
jgi:hypothetical protein